MDIKRKQICLNNDSNINFSFNISSAADLFYCKQTFKNKSLIIYLSSTYMQYKQFAHCSVALLSSLYSSISFNAFNCFNGWKKEKEQWFSLLWTPQCLTKYLSSRTEHYSGQYILFEKRVPFIKATFTKMLVGATQILF